MDAGWIQVFVLVLTECVAPAGKTVCQEQEVRYEFLSKADCETVLQQLTSYKGASEDVIVNAEKSACLPSAAKQTVYPSLADANEALQGTEGWGEIEVDDDAVDFIQQAHQERLASLSECSEVAGVAPCKIGDIIIEGATEKKSEVWQRAN